MNKAKFDCWFTLFLIAITFGVLLNEIKEIKSERKVKVEYQHPEQYIIYDMTSNDSLVVGKVTGRYDTGTMYVLTINDKDYIVTEEQYNAVNTGDTVFTHVKEVE